MITHRSFAWHALNAATRFQKTVAGLLRAACATRLLSLLLLLALAAVAQAQFTYTVNNDTITLTWNSLLATTYQVQYETNLALANWVNLGSAITATNGTVSASDLLGPDKQRFYRILSVGPASTLWSNAATITINDYAPATPYPSCITVAGLSGTILNATVTLNGFWHSYPSDLSVLVVSPQNLQVVLMSEVGRGVATGTNVFITFDSRATNTLPQTTPITSGVYLPADYRLVDTFFSPAPSGPFAKTLSVFNGQTPNGIWSLYVEDTVISDSGIISGGWTLNIATD